MDGALTRPVIDGLNLGANETGIEVLNGSRLRIGGVTFQNFAGTAIDANNSDTTVLGAKFSANGVGLTGTGTLFLTSTLVEANTTGVSWIGMAEYVSCQIFSNQTGINSSGDNGKTSSCQVENNTIGISFTGNDNSLFLTEYTGNSEGLIIKGNSNIVQLNTFDLNNQSMHVMGSDNDVKENKFSLDQIAALFGSPPGKKKGVEIPTTNNTFGGTAASDRNIIYRSIAPLRIESATGTLVQGNYFGLLEDGGDSGFSLDTCAIGIVDSPDTVIGGAEAGAGNVIASHNQQAILAQGTSTTGLQIINNRIGTDPTGTTAIPILDSAVLLGGITGAVIRGNQISGTGTNISMAAIHLVSCSNAIIQGNLIGVSADGMSPISNNGSGIFINGGSGGNLIGGPGAEDGNVISGNLGHGIQMINTPSNTIQGNLIGTNASGDAAIANARNGIYVTAASSTNTIIGGTEQGEGNLISGNGWNGIEVAFFNTGAMIQGNTIGADITGDLGIPNTLNGVKLLDTTDNLLGGAQVAAGNQIAFNTEYGVLVAVETGDTTVRNTIRLNSIHDNTLGGISLDPEGNEDIAAPEITELGSVIGTAPPNSTVDIYADDGDQGEIFLASTTAQGDGSFFSGVSLFDCIGMNVTAVATDADGNSSQFSGGVVIPDTVSDSPPDDVNQDGSTNSQDIQLVINRVLGNDIGSFNADVNSDGSVNSVDIQTVINSVLGI